MSYFGPVANAAHGGHASPSFDLFIGFAMLAAVWWGFWSKRGNRKQTLMVSLGASVISFVFIGFGIAELLR